MTTMALAGMFRESMDSTVLDRFGGARAWDLFEAGLEAQYMEMILGRTCLDCGNCTRCDIEGHESIGYCSEVGEFVDDSQLVSEHGCETFSL